jgi:rhodanese-related sulfurtransferase
MMPLAGLPTVDADAAQSATDAVLLDVRERDEWSLGHAPAAVLVPMSELARRIDELDVTRRIVCVCRSGNRSARVTAFLIQQGYDAVNLAGGMYAWASAGHPVVTSAGGPGVVI